MGYFKSEHGGYILGVGIVKGDGNISETEYNALTDVIHTKPASVNGCEYRLKTDLTWELYELPTLDEVDDPELTAEEALDIIVGGRVDA